MRSLDGSNIVVVGGAGFIGSHIVDQLLEERVQRVVVLDDFARGVLNNLDRAKSDPRLDVVQGSILDHRLVAETLAGADYVFLLAALWLYECVHQPRAAVEVNIGGTFNVIEAAHQAGVKKVVFSSSASVYGNALFTPMTEEHPFNNRTTYGATKIAGEQLFRAFNEQHGLDYIALRYMNVYGPRMDRKGAYVSVIMKVLDRIDTGEPPIIHGDGTQTFDFVHVEDVARANILALKSRATDECVNVGIGVPTTIRNLVVLLLRLADSSLQPVYQPGQMFVTHRVGSTEKAERLLGFQARVSLEDGLRSVLSWHYPGRVFAGR